MITRRNFIKTLALVPFIDWGKSVRFKLHSEPLPHHWYGIPYHQSDGTIGAWLGMPRGNSIHKEVAELVSIMEKDKNNARC